MKENPGKSTKNISENISFDENGLEKKLSSKRNLNEGFFY